MNENGVVEAVQVLSESPISTVLLQSRGPVEVRVCNGRGLPVMLNLVSDVASDLGLTLSDAEGIEEKLLGRLNDVSFLLKLIAKHTQGVYDVTASATSLESADAVAELPVDDLFNVVTRVVEVNKDFFIKRVLPLLRSVKQARGSTAT